MKKILLTLFLLCGLTYSNTSKQAEVVINAKLVEITSKLPGNDLYNYVYIFKFKVIKVLSGTLAEKEVFVGVYNPLIPRSQVKDKMDKWVDGDVQSFKAGATYQLTLVKPLDKYWNEAVEDEYFDIETERWYAKAANIVK